MNKKEVIFVLLNELADWEGAYIATCLNIGVKSGRPIKLYSKDDVYNERTNRINRSFQSIAWLRFE